MPNDPDPFPTPQALRTFNEYIIGVVGVAALAMACWLLTPNVRDGQMLKDLADEIHDGSHRLNRVVNNLLDMNRLESGVIRPNCEWCDVRELLQSAIEIERESIDSRDVRLRVAEPLPLA